jgi:peptidoglycan/xylan/chitin deacetylase (PgdA/CDA1 family)
MKIIVRRIGLYAVLGMMCCWTGCSKQPVTAMNPPSGESDSIINHGAIPKILPGRWKDNKKAAYTIAFDDSRPSHYQVALPELLARGLQGTFYLNTKVITKWQPWQYLLEAGQEIGSHTWSHVNCSKLSEDMFREELARAKRDLERHIPDVQPILSFSFPFGAFNEMNLRIISEYHLSARCGGGINCGDIKADELNCLKGIGVYPPYDMARINGYVAEVIKNGGWLIIYFHSVSAKEESANAVIPLSLFRKHLDYVCSLKESLWIAPQGEIAEFIRAR